MLKNTTTTFGGLTKFFHWILFLLICMQFYWVWGRNLLPQNSWVRGEYIFLHKSFGIAVLILSMLFVLWRNFNKKPSPSIPQPRWKHIAATAVHHLLLILMVLIPIIGYLMVSAAGRSINFFGLFNLPNLMEKNEVWGDIFFQLHEKLAYLFLLIVAIHIVAALQHHFILKNDVLKRMLPFYKK